MIMFQHRRGGGGGENRELVNEHEREMHELEVIKHTSWMERHPQGRYNGNLREFDSFLIVIASDPKPTNQSIKIILLHIPA